MIFLGLQTGFRMVLFENMVPWYPLVHWQQLAVHVVVVATDKSAPESSKTSYHEGLDVAMSKNNMHTCICMHAHKNYIHTCISTCNIPVYIMYVYVYRHICILILQWFHKDLMELVDMCIELIHMQINGVILHQ